MIAVAHTELAVRDWLRDDEDLLDLVGNDARRIDADFSGDSSLTHLTLHRAGGGASSELPFDDAVMVFDCWGRGRGAALNLATALVQKLVNAKEERLNDEAWLRGCAVQSNLYLPDPSGQARYAITSLLRVSVRNDES